MTPAARMPRRASIRSRLLAAFVFLALSMGAALGVVGHVSFDALGSYLVGWHARPVMEALMEAERRAWEAEDSGHGQIYSGEDLALVMHWRFLVGKQVPPVWRALPDGLHFINDMEEFILVERRDNVEYVLNGGTGGLQALKMRLRGVLLLCAASGLALAVVLAVVLSRRLANPLSRLTRAVENCPPQHALTPFSPPNRPPAPPVLKDAAALVPPVPPIPMTDLEDEVGVLARAIAAREDALQRFVQRETSFTGDVSHELRTPLTVLQGGLEILELRLASLPEAAALTPVVRRLLRTIARMSGTVRTLLLLARRPEELEFHSLDCGALLLSLARDMERDGLLRLVKAAGDEEREEDEGTALHGLGPVPGAGLPTRRAPVLLRADLADGIQVCGHRELAGIIFKNLLDNACQYTENGQVSAALRAGELRVQNSGRIPDGLDVFARGVRCGRKADGAGSGLGLSLALRACERLGWRLDMASAVPEAETVFRVRFSPAEKGEGMSCPTPGTG